MEEIHHELKLDLQWRGAPQPAETIKCAANVCEEEIQSVDPAVFSYFKSAAQQLIAAMGAEKAMCAALAKLSGAVMTSGDVISELLFFLAVALNFRTLIPTFYYYSMYYDGQDSLRSPLHGP